MTTDTLPKQTEKQFMQAVTDYARFMGYKVYHTHDSRRSEPGFPDLVICGHGKVVFAELKREGGKVSLAQGQWIWALQVAGQQAYVWTPADWDAIESVLR